MTWQSWESVGGTLTSAPAASSWSSGRLDVFVRGTDSAVMHRWYDNGWSDWESLGGVFTSKPAAVSWDDGRIDVFARGTDSALWHRWYDNGWSDWESLGGQLGSGPAVSSWAPGRLDVFMRGTDSALWHKAYDNGWSDWESLGGLLTDSPTAVSWSSGQIDVFGVGADSALQHRWYDNGWSDWQSLGGVLASAPAVASWASGRLDVFFAGTDSALWHRWYDNGWAGWESLGSVLISAPAAVSSGGDRIDVFVTGPDSALWHTWWEVSVPTTFVRREAWALESVESFDPITLAYAKAVQTMQARPASDPTSWTYQAAIHGSFAAPPPGATWNECQHRSWFFLPWHRMYLYFFERIVRKAVLDAGGPVDFALPYWNYDEPFPGNTLPPAFRRPTLPDGTANPLFVPPPERDVTLMNGGQVPPTATTSTLAMARTNFSAPPGSPSFGGGRVAPAHFGNALGAMESTPHNAMHPTIGGFQVVDPCQGALMTDPDCAALDPVFWLHHANVDRLWNRWLELGAGRANPTEVDWLKQSFVFHDETGAQAMLSGADIVDSAAQLHYVYDDAAAPFQRMVTLAATSPPGEGPPELAAASEQPLELIGSTASVRMTLPASSRELVESAGDEGRVLVSVEDIEAARDPGLAYAVYLDAGGGPGGDRHHIGNVSFFGIEAMNDPDQPHEGEAGFGHTFDATESVNALKARGRWDPALISVTFEPIRVLPPPGEELSEEARSQAAAPVPPVRIGRVSLFVA